MTFIPWIIVACWATFILYWIISSFGVKRDATRSLWQNLWWFRVGFVFIILVWLWDTSRLGMVTRQLPYFNGSTLPAWAPIGALLNVLGIGIAIWARVHLGRNWSPAPAIKEEHELVMSGPYRLVRHPIYTGVILAVLGSTLASPTWLPVFFIVSGLFVWRVYKEEALMTELFPNQYPEYKKHTWALIPWIW